MCQVIPQLIATLNHKQTWATTTESQMTDFRRSTWRQQAREGRESRAWVCACAGPDAAAQPILPADVPLPPSFSCHCVFREEEEEKKKEESRFLSFFSSQKTNVSDAPGTFSSDPFRCSSDAGYFSSTAEGTSAQTEWEERRADLTGRKDRRLDWEAAHPPLSLIQPQFAVYFNPTCSLPTCVRVFDGVRWFLLLFPWPFLRWETHIFFFFLTFVTQKKITLAS